MVPDRASTGWFLTEHLPRAAATYRVTTFAYGATKAWIAKSSFQSLIRTTGLIAAVRSGWALCLIRPQRDRTASWSRGRPDFAFIRSPAGVGPSEHSATCRRLALFPSYRRSPAVPLLTSLADAAQDTPCTSSGDRREIVCARQFAGTLLSAVLISSEKVGGPAGLGVGVVIYSWPCEKLFSLFR